MKKRHLLKKIQETLYIGQWCLSLPQHSKHFRTSHSSPVFVERSPYTFNILRCPACCRPSRTCITFSRFSTIFEAFVSHFYLHCTHCITSESLLSHLNSFRRGMPKLNAKCDADSLLYLLSHFECNSHTVHMLTRRFLPSPPTSTAKSSLFMHAHSSPCSLAARLHQCHPNHSYYTDNGWTFSGQISYTSIVEHERS